MGQGANLCSYNNFVSNVAQCVTQNFLAVAVAIQVGGVIESNAGIKGKAQGGFGDIVVYRTVRIATESPCTKPDFRYFYSSIAKFSVFHLLFPNNSCSSVASAFTCHSNASGGFPIGITKPLDGVFQTDLKWCILES